MKLTRWQPAELGSFRREMDRLFDSFLTREPFFSKDGEWFPEIDVEETPEEVVVTAELPGMDQKDITVSLSGDSLVIRGEKRREEEKKEKHFHRVERSYGRFERVIPVPASTDAKKISAEYARGVLEVHLPKKPNDMPRKIDVKAK